MLLDMMKKVMVSQNNLVAGVTAFKAENEQAMVKVDKVTNGLEAVERNSHVRPELLRQVRRARRSRQGGSFLCRVV